MSDFIFIFHVMSLCWHEYVYVIFTHELSLIYSLVLFFIQVGVLQSVRDQLFFSGFSSEVKPLSSERTGSEWQRPAGLRSEGAAWSGAEFRLSTGDSEVSRWLESVHAAFISILLNTVSITVQIQGLCYQAGFVVIRFTSGLVLSVLRSLFTS